MLKKRIQTKGKVKFIDVVREVAARNEITVKVAQNAINTFCDIIKEQLYEGMSIKIPTFGSFTLKKLKGRMYVTVIDNHVESGPKQMTVYKPDRLAPHFIFDGPFTKQIQEATAYKESELTDLEDLMDEET